MDLPSIGSGGLPDLGGFSKDELENGQRDQLLICGDCETIEHIPAFDGPMEHDQAHQARLRNHLVPLADGISTHAIAYTTVNAELWKTREDFRTYVVSAINAARKTGDVGLGANLYDLRSTFAEDAMACWRGEHNRTQNCADYRADKKRLVPPTRDERRELGLETRSRQIYTTAYLCDYCPYKSIVMQRARKAKGVY